jgi:predicted component of type VI protein secretion system
VKFVLQYGPRELDLPDGRFVIGRADGAGLTLDDPLVSRHHAAIDVAGGVATLVDLDSRNGVRVNGKKVTRERVLVPGDRIGIGSHELVFARPQAEPAAQTLVQAPTLRMTTFGLIGMLADKALALGRGDEAERLLAPQLEHLLADVERGKKHDPAQIDRACEYALKIASATGNAAWIDSVFRFYRAAGRLCPSAIVDELYAVARKVKQPNVDALRAYLAAIRERELGPADRFLVSRLEGLERSLG